MVAKAHRLARSKEWLIQVATNLKSTILCRERLCHFNLCHSNQYSNTVAAIITIIGVLFMTSFCD